MRISFGLFVALLGVLACNRPRADAPRATFHVADVVRSSETWETTLPGTEVPLFVSEPPVVTADDIISAELWDPKDNQIRIAVQFRADAAQRLLAATRAHQDQWIAIVVDGRVVSAPLIRGEFGPHVMVTVPQGHWQAQAILAAFLPPKKGTKA